MFKPLFKPVSPLWGWFILMDLASGLCIIGYWIECQGHGARPWEPGPEVGMLFTGLYVTANILLFRNRRLAAIGFAICWPMMILALAAF